MIENEKIVKFVLKDDENILWSQKPCITKHPIFDRSLRKTIFKYFFIISLCIGSIISIIQGYFFKSFLLGVISILFQTLIIFLGLIFFFWITSKIYNDEQELIRETDYYITDKQIFSIRLVTETSYDEGERRFKEIVNIPLSNIEYFFYKKKKEIPKLIYSIFFKTKFELSDYRKESILIRKNINNSKLGVEFHEKPYKKIKRKAKSLETIEELKYVYDIERVKEILIKKLGIFMQEPPFNWQKRYFRGEFHPTGFFH